MKRVEQIHDLTPAEKELLGGVANLLLIGREETEQLEWEPSSLYVIRHVQLTYARRDAAAAPQFAAPQFAAPPLAASGSAAPDIVAPSVITAQKPPQPIPGGLPGPGLLAHVATAKYVDHIPLHRQERQFARHGLADEAAGDDEEQTTSMWPRLRSCGPIEASRFTHVSLPPHIPPGRRRAGSDLF